VTLLGAGAATVLQRLDGGFTLHVFAGRPRWALVAVVLVLIDLANWTSHLYNHRVEAFWRFHALHHSQEELSVLTSFRAHPLMHTNGFLLATVPVLVDFWAPWCGPCRATSPVVDALAREQPGNLLTLKVNTDDSPTAAEKFGIQGIPTFILFRNGEIVARRSGAMGKSALADWVAQASAGSKSAPKS